MLTQDDYYEGYFIPKGTILFANAWAIHMDENEYETPQEYRPERFLKNKYGCKAEGYRPDDNRRVTYGFGAGRRVCPGQRLAENSLVYIMIYIDFLKFLTRILDAQHGQTRLAF